MDQGTPENGQTGSNTDTIGNQFNEELIELNNQRMEFERQGDFLSAGTVKKKLEELGTHYEKKMSHDMHSNHQAQRQELEQRYQQEIQSCSEFWQNKIVEFDHKSNEMRTQMEEKQAEQLAGYEAHLRETLKHVPKLSPEVLNLQFQINQLAKDQRYDEAHTLNKKMEKLREDCLKRDGSLVEQKIKSLVRIQKRNQEKEHEAFLMKIETGRQDILKGKEKEIKTVISKHKVLIENLQDSQILEFKKFEKKLKSFKPSSNFLIKQEQE